MNKMLQMLVIIVPLCFYTQNTHKVYNEFPNTKLDNYLKNNPLKTKLDSFIDIAVKNYMSDSRNCGLSIGIINNDSSFIYHYGEYRRLSGQLPNNETVYQIGSISNTFTAWLLSKAIKENKISLDDDIKKYLPKHNYQHLNYKNIPILIRHLVTHTSGLPEIPSNLQNQTFFDYNNPYKNYTNELLLADLKTIVLHEEPGTHCAYSNYGMGLLGYILQNIYAADFENILKEKLLLPNNLNTTKITLTKTDSLKLAIGINEAGKNTCTWQFGAMQGCGALYSSLNDMLLYLKLNLSQNQSALYETHTVLFALKEKMGMAWQIIKRQNQNQLIWHNGGTGGFYSFIGFYPEKKTGIVVLANSFPKTDIIPLSILEFLLE
ncbi:MAG: beta-lactamase family protein [Bacteroidetes bacterium]|nr:beta-lactamase family protein [Bacteroidota bacterium]